MGLRSAVIGGAIILAAVCAYFSFFREREIMNYPPPNDTIVAFGDSLIVGQGATKGNDFVSVLSQKLGKPIINLGVSGNTTAQGKARVSELNDHNPGIVIILLGGNDYLQKIPEDETFRNLKDIIQRIEERGAMVVLLGVRGGLINDHYDTRFKKLAREMGTLYVSDVLEGLVGNASLMSDAVHPNDVGYARIAERVYLEMEPYLGPK